MSGTDGFPSVPAAEPERPWRADLGRFRRQVLAALAVVGVFGVAAWWTRDVVGTFAVSASVLATVGLVVIFVRQDRHGARLDGLDARVTKLDHVTDQQHLSVLAVSERQRNHELDCGRDELARRRAKRETS